MKTLSCVLLLMASTAFVLFGCTDNSNSLVTSGERAGGTGLAKASVVHSKTVVPVEYTSPDPSGCLEGDVHVYGHVTVNLQLVYDANGDLKLSSTHVNITQLVLTTASGLVCNINEVTKEMYTYGGAHTVTVTDHATVTSPQEGKIVHATIHTRVTWTPDGNSTGVVERIDFQCE